MGRGYLARCTKTILLVPIFLLHLKKDLDIDLIKYLVITNGMKTMDERIQ